MKLTDNEAKLLRLLQKEGRLRYSDLLEKMRMSTSSLSKMLKRLQEKGLIKRFQESTSYPPPVYYEITDKGKLAVSAERAYMALIELDSPEEAEKLLEEIEKKIKEAKKK